MKLGANSVLFCGYGMETAFKYLAMAGYDGIEPSAIDGMSTHLVLENWRELAPEITRLAQVYGLELLAIEQPSRDPVKMEQALQAAVEIGIPIINCGPGGKSGDAASLQHRFLHAHLGADQGAISRRCDGKFDAEPLGIFHLAFGEDSRTAKPLRGDAGKVYPGDVAQALLAQVELHEVHFVELHRPFFDIPVINPSRLYLLCILKPIRQFLVLWPHRPLLSCHEGYDIHTLNPCL